MSVQIYSGNSFVWSDEHLEHHGISGQKWGVRRYQNEDGSLTEEGRKRYGAMKSHDDKVAANFRKGKPGASGDMVVKNIAKLNVDKSSLAKYHNDVSAGKNKAWSMTKAVLKTEVKDYAFQVAAATGGAVVGGILAGPYGSYALSGLAATGVNVYRKGSRFVDTVKYDVQAGKQKK